MLLTRCPHCATVFRVSDEQLAARNGRVRCGQCRAAFDASEQLLPDTVPTAPSVAPVSPPPPVEPLEPPREAERPPIAPLAAIDIPAWEEPEEQRREPLIGPADETDPLFSAPTAPLPASDTPLIDPPTEDEAQAGELVIPPLSAIEAVETPLQPPPTRPVWPFVIAGTLLSLLLVLQLTHRFRTEISVLLPGARALYSALGIEVPLPRQSELIGIESSDLQADTARSLLILNAQLKNRAPYSQSYPALEVTLTDARDAVLLRRVLQPADYLSPDSPPLFAPNGELTLKLWLDPGNTGATGYRLYVFYP